MDSNSIFEIKSDLDFKNKALEIFFFQYENNIIYNSFCKLIKKDPSCVNKIEDIPFLPISFFKNHIVKINSHKTQKIFTSSGTTGSLLSKHHVVDLNLYERSFEKSFEIFYGDIKDYTILALLPSYLERNNSSLIYMTNKMIVKSQNLKSRFYLNQMNELKETILELEKNEQKTILIGVSYALLDLIEFFKFNLNHTVVIETGGMKGKRKEMIKNELHKKLKEGFGLDHIHSEYGMTEILSQAYSKRDGIFKTPNWMKVIIRDINDPLNLKFNKNSGGINIIDLANLYSCSFIATEDLGKTNEKNEFEILGRIDNSDLRGCNLLLD
ncbi:MAG: acyl transferase [Flavobacteriaceae bacterium]|nr:acyl transferase [Flavobacteriaceae bacterium]|tara:strand:- start:2296 stop:3273 length:978 start_codon:yes stop_codon:yes gene_type:complete